MAAAAFPNLKNTFIPASDGDADTIDGTQLRDSIDADGKDTVLAGAGDDFIIGGGTVNAGAGDDVVDGSTGSVDLGAGDDRLVDPATGPFGGGPGTDTLQLQTAPADTFGAASSISLTFTDSALTERADATPAQTFEVDGFEVLDIALPASIPHETYDARAFSGRSVVRGFDGVDVLLGGKGDDVLDGGTGNDTINPGAGYDTVFGGRATTQSTCATARPTSSTAARGPTPSRPTAPTP